MFTPPLLSKEPDPVSRENGSFMAIYFHGQKVKFSEVFTQTDRNFASDFNQIWYL